MKGAGSKGATIFNKKKEAATEEKGGGVVKLVQEGKRTQIVESLLEKRPKHASKGNVSR